MPQVLSSFFLLLYTMRHGFSPVANYFIHRLKLQSQKMTLNKLDNTGIVIDK